MVCQKCEKNGSLLRQLRQVKLPMRCAMWIKKWMSVTNQPITGTSLFFSYIGHILQRYGALI